MTLEALHTGGDLDAILEESYNDIGYFGKAFFPDTFWRDFSPNHYRLFRAIQDPEIKKVVVVAPRGIGKTKIIQLLTPAHQILFGERKFIVTISKSAGHAIMQSEALKAEFMTNPLINRAFGEMRSESWSKDSWITKTGTMVLPRGSGQMVRGMIFGNYRPDYIIVDDVEDSDSIMSDEQREKIYQWFMADVVNSIDVGSDHAKIIVIGNMLHQNCLPARLLDDPDWYGFRLDILDERGETAWPSYMTTEQINAKAESFRRQGLIDVFYREFRCLPVASEALLFPQKVFKYYEEKDIAKVKSIENVVLIDPAKTVTRKSAKSAIVGVGVDMENGAIYIRDIVCDRFHPEELMQECFDMCERLNAAVLGVEVTSLNEFITWPIKNEIARRGLRIEFIELKARASKEERVHQLAPLYRSGLIYHNKIVCGPLEEQLMAFPRAAYWDIMDALAYIVPLMDEGERFMYADSFESSDMIEDEYADLDAEDKYDPAADFRLV